MTRDQIFEIWAHPSAAWSSWAKPVLFAHVQSQMQSPYFLPPILEERWMTEVNGELAMVCDLPGELCVGMAVHLGGKGYRPVPLFNAVPAPFIHPVGDSSACDLWPVVAALQTAAPMLAACRLPIDAPPVFMLDAFRRESRVPLSPGVYDNRSVSLTTDFPSANRLLSAGIKRAIVIQYESITPQSDLAHTLLRWQEAGIKMEAVTLVAGAMPQQITIAAPRFYRMIWQRLTATLGLRRNPIGGFGGVLPIPSSSGG